jgi:hypothetical protein
LPNQVLLIGPSNAAQVKIGRSANWELNLDAANNYATLGLNGTNYIEADGNELRLGTGAKIVATQGSHYVLGGRMRAPNVTVDGALGGVDTFGPFPLQLGADGYGSQATAVNVTPPLNLGDGHIDTKVLDDDIVMGNTRAKRVKIGRPANWELAVDTAIDQLQMKHNGTVMFNATIGGLLLGDGLTQTQIQGSLYVPSGRITATNIDQGLVSGGIDTSAPFPLRLGTNGYGANATNVYVFPPLHVGDGHIDSIGFDAPLLAVGETNAKRVKLGRSTNWQLDVNADLNKFEAAYNGTKYIELGPLDCKLGTPAIPVQLVGPVKLANGSIDRVTPGVITVGNGQATGVNVYPPLDLGPGSSIEALQVADPIRVGTTALSAGSQIHLGLPTVVNAASASSFLLPTTRGTSNQVIISDGIGGAFWATQTGLVPGGGTAGQLLTSDGIGGRSWTTFAQKYLFAFITGSTQGSLWINDTTFSVTLFTAPLTIAYNTAGMSQLSNGIFTYNNAIGGTFQIRARGSVKLSAGATKDVYAAICINGTPWGAPARSLSAAAAANIAPFDCQVVRNLVFGDAISIRLKVVGMANLQFWTVDSMDFEMIWVGA